ncbi:unnamed protein product [Aureobasidium uvarum]|uniref:Uncharacterized protein n=1 Tax=Aureobasidium uvarum TaxID=2773716 RepID=A0A9N8KCH4_9PEZI|nr:unnamed protein product [Aureobasidium uvarum]
MARITFGLAYFTLLVPCLLEQIQGQTPHVWIVGLRESQTVEKHLDFVGRPIAVEERRPEINGYTASIADADTELFKAIRKDPTVGFVVKMPEDYFRKIEKIIEDGWEDDDRDLYEYMTYPHHHWHDLQDRDHEIITTDDGGIKIHLSWTVRLEEGYTVDEHIYRITGKQFPLFDVVRSSFVNGYSVYFVNGEQEKKFCRLIQADFRVDSIGPVRSYKMNDGTHANPHDVCLSLR